MVSILGENVCSLVGFIYICAAIEFESLAERWHFSEAADVCGFSLQRRNKQNKRSCIHGEWYDDGELKSLLVDPERFESFVKTHTRISIGTCYHPNGVMEDISVVYEDGELYPKLVRYKDGVYYAKDGFIYMLVPSAKWSSDNAIRESYEVRGDTLRIGFYEEHPEGHLYSRRKIVPSECPKNPFVK